MNVGSLCVTLTLVVVLVLGGGGGGIGITLKNFTETFFYVMQGCHGQGKISGK